MMGMSSSLIVWYVSTTLLDSLRGILSQDLGKCNWIPFAGRQRFGS